MDTNKILEKYSSLVETLKCPMEGCGKEKKKISQLKSHLKSAHQKRQHFCIICDKMFVHRYQLKSHIESTHEGFYCDPCKLQLSSEEKMEDHNQKSHDGMKYICVQCKKSHSSQLRLNVHCKSEKHKMNEATKEILNLSCNDCGKAISSQTKLMTHLKQAHTKKPTECDECDYKPNYKTGNSNALKIHKENIHMKIKHICVHCQTECTTKSNLTVHITKYHTEENIACQKCNNAIFATRWDFVNHKREMHPKVQIKKEKAPRPKKVRQICDMCGYEPSYSSPTAIRIHKAAVHLGIKHVCDQCGKECTTKSNLTKHIAKYHGDGFPCQSCDFKAQLKDGLKFHIESVHLGIRYQCNFEGCSHSSLLKSSLRIHRAKKHAEKLIPCLICDEKFAIEYLLKQHIASKHGGLYCTKCSYQPYTTEEYEYHNEISHNGNSFSLQKKPPLLKRCQEIYFTDCSFSSFKRRTLREHHSSFHAHLPFTCNLCSFDFNSSKALRIHQRVHQATAHRENPNIVAVKTESPVSFDIFETENVFDDSLESSNGLPLNCGECDFKSVRLYDLRNHKSLVHDYTKWAEANGIDVLGWQPPPSV